MSAKGRERTFPTQAGDFSGWYLGLLEQAGWFRYSPVPGSIYMLEPSTFVWEAIRAWMDRRFKQLGIRNVILPSHIPLNLFEKEATFAAGFAPELAVLDHVQQHEDDPEGGPPKLVRKEIAPLAMAPTSELLFCDLWKGILGSYRDLPFRHNQWTHVYRVEKKPRPFLRTFQFSWQEVHAIFETDEECREFVDVLRMLYKELCEELLCISVVEGDKPNDDKFAGAKTTTCVESLMRDGKTLQMGTSHDLGQGFMRGFDVTFHGRDGTQQTPFYMSAGVSTRLIGATVMAHGDDRGIVLPPGLAETQAMVVPIFGSDNRDLMVSGAHGLAAALRHQMPDLRIQVDDRDMKPGSRLNDADMRGVPMTIKLGPQEMASRTFRPALRKVDGMEPFRFADAEIPFPDDGSQHEGVWNVLDHFQRELFARHRRFQQGRTHDFTNGAAYEDFAGMFSDEAMRGYGIAWMCNDTECRAQVKSDTGGASSRIVMEKGSAPCLHCGRPATEKKVFAKAY